MLFALITPWAAFGQNHTLTVYDGEVTKKSVPMYVYYFDDFSRSQYVIPATQIDAMTTGTISAIKYYTSFTQEYTTLSEVDIYLAGNHQCLHRQQFHNGVCHQAPQLHRRQV